MSPTWVGIFGDVAPTVMYGMPAALERRRRRDHGVRVGVADEGLDLVLFDELLGGLRRDVHVVLAVMDDEVDLPAEDAARGVDLLDRQLRAVGGRQVEDGFVAGQREATTDLDRAAAGGHACRSASAALPAALGAALGPVPVDAGALDPPELLHAATSASTDTSANPRASWVRIMPPPPLQGPLVSEPGQCSAGFRWRTTPVAVGEARRGGACVAAALLAHAP